MKSWWFLTISPTCVAFFPPPSLSATLPLNIEGTVSQDFLTPVFSCNNVSPICFPSSQAKNVNSLRYHIHQFGCLIAVALHKITLNKHGQATISLHWNWNLRRRARASRRLDLRLVSPMALTCTHACMRACAPAEGQNARRHCHYYCTYLWPHLRYCNQPFGLKIHILFYMYSIQYMFALFL